MTSTKEPESLITTGTGAPASGHLPPDTLWRMQLEVPYLKWIIFQMISYSQMNAILTDKTTQIYPNSILAFLLSYSLMQKLIPAPKSGKSRWRMCGYYVTQKIILYTLYPLSVNGHPSLNFKAPPQSVSQSSESVKSEGIC